jgi:D-alanine-D-alanine ligase
MNKINIALFFGGNSLEYNVSLKSSYDIAKELEVNKNYNLIYIGILKNNIFLYNNNIDEIIIYNSDINKININENNKKIYQIGNGKINNIKIDLAFLGTHGGVTEDGNLQGFLNLNNIKFTGCDIIGSVLCMNKSLTKSLCKDYNIPIVEYYKFTKNNFLINKIPEIINKLGENLIIKINNGGSSIGIFFSNKNNLLENILKAFDICDIILIEKVIECKEYSIGIIENYPNLLVSDIGQFNKENNFFDYNTKYNSNLGNTINIDLEEEIKIKIKNYSIILFKELLIKNYARFDFFVHNNEIYFNEINTLPGLYKSSLFIKLWENNNMNYRDILNLIINNSLL